MGLNLVGFLVSGFDVSGNPETNENQRKPWIYFDILLMRIMMQDMRRRCLTSAFACGNILLCRPSKRVSMGPSPVAILYPCYCILTYWMSI
jgi:hypothetical protein